MTGKRLFYEDEALVVTKPGENSEINQELKEKESAHGYASFVHGMGIRTMPYLEKQASALRLFLHDKFTVWEAELSTQKTALSNEWSNFKTHVDDVILDPLFPGVVSFVLPILATNVFVSRRMLPTRFLAAAAVTGLSLKYNMPLTYEASKKKYLAWQKDYMPEFHAQSLQLKEKIGILLEDSKTLRDDAKLDLQRQIHNVRKAIIEVFSDE